MQIVRHSVIAISPALMPAICHFCIFNRRIFHVRVINRDVELSNFIALHGDEIVPYFSTLPTFRKFNISYASKILKTIFKINIEQFLLLDFY